MCLGVCNGQLPKSEKPTNRGNCVIGQINLKFVILLLSQSY